MKSDLEAVAGHVWRDSKAPAAAGLKAKILDAAREHASLMREADAMALCGPDCPEAKRFARRGIPHAHTLGDLYRMLEGGRYEMELALRNRGEESPDVPRILARWGANREHTIRLAQAVNKVSALEDRATNAVARFWWAEGRKSHPWLALLGEANAGKTLAATSCLWKHAAAYPWNSMPSGGEARQPGAFLRVQAFSRMAPWGEEHEALQAAELVVLDDFAAEHLRPEAEGMLTELLDVRYGRGAMTVLTSQLSTPAFRARYDKASDGDGPGRLWRRIQAKALILEGDVLWRDGVAVPEKEWRTRR